MGSAGPNLIYCASGNPAFAAAAVAAGWRYGARLPATVYQQVYFADQDWKSPDRAAYMQALDRHRPAMATVLDWEREEQLPEVLAWAEEASQYVESILIVPKVPGLVGRIPRAVNGKRIVLAYSVPTSYGASPLGLWEYAGWPVHLLGGSPQRQMDAWRYLRGICDVGSVDGNMPAQQARKGRVWSAQPWGPDSLRWVQLRDLGDDRKENVPLECFRRSLVEIRDAWRRISC